MPQNRANAICTDEGKLKVEQANLRIPLTGHENSLKFTKPSPQQQPEVLQ
jgi:hypothetical protein